ncbi:MAG: hypothetical protein RH917_06350 [Lacipirellulaceae bacterium]
MKSHLSTNRFVFLLVLVAVTFSATSMLAESAEAQILRRRRAVVQAPPVSVVQPVAPVVRRPLLNGILLEQPLVLRRPLLPRRRAALTTEEVPQPAFEPRPEGSPDLGDNEQSVPEPRKFATPPPTPAGEPTLAEMQTTYPTAAEIATFDDTQLLNALHAASKDLDKDLDQFTSSESWQRYLKLPDDSLPPAVDGQVQLGMRSLEKTLQRFEGVSLNEKYAQISSLASFQMMHAALRETVERFNRPPAPAIAPEAPAAASGPALGSPVEPKKAAQQPAVEAIPTPAEVPTAESETGPREHSVLKRIIKD